MEKGEKQENWKSLFFLATYNMSLFLFCFAEKEKKDGSFEKNRETFLRA
jgi:hypothetical protein